MTLATDPNSGLEYRPKPVPIDRPVYLVLRDRLGVFRSVSAYRWDREIWVAVNSGRALSSSLDILGWVDPEDGPT